MSFARSSTSGRAEPKIPRMPHMLASTGEEALGQLTPPQGGRCLGDDSSDIQSATDATDATDALLLPTTLLLRTALMFFEVR